MHKDESKEKESLWNPWYAKRIPLLENMTNGLCAPSRQNLRVILAWSLSLRSFFLGSSSSRWDQKRTFWWVEYQVPDASSLFLYQPLYSSVPVSFLDFMVVWQLDNDSLPVSPTLPDFSHALYLDSVHNLGLPEAPLIYTFISCFLYVPWSETEPATLAYQEDMLTSWATRSGPPLFSSSNFLLRLN